MLRVDFTGTGFSQSNASMKTASVFTDVNQTLLKYKTYAEKVMKGQMACATMQHFGKCD